MSNVQTNGTPIMKVTWVSFFLLAASGAGAQTTQFCIEGEFNLGLRMQHHHLGDAWEPTNWCVTTDQSSHRVLFSMTGKSNPDVVGDWSVAYFPPDVVRIVNRNDPPDIEFQGTDNAEEARSVRRLDPRRLAEMEAVNPSPDLRIGWESGLPRLVAMQATLPLQGEIKVTWSWNWGDPQKPRLVVSTAPKMATLFRGTGRWRILSAEEAVDVWGVTPGADKVEVPGDRWPSRVATELLKLTDDVYLVQGVRSGFQHLVVATADGLVVADAPANWLEIHQLPPANMVADLPIDGISQNLINFLQGQFEDQKLLAVALTHFHDDHAGGAPAFAAAGAQVYAPRHTAKALEHAFAERDGAAVTLDIIGVGPAGLTLGQPGNEVRLVPLGNNPHVYEMLGVWAVDRGYFFVSDIHVPGDESAPPPAARAQSECWFARWATANLPSDVKVVNSHSPVVTTVATLAEYPLSETCVATASQAETSG